MQDKFIFIESNTSGTGALLIEKVIQKGLVPILLTCNPDKYSFLPLPALTTVTLDTNDFEALLNYLRDLSSIKGIFSSSEYFVDITSRVARALSLPHSNPSSVARCRSKSFLVNLQSSIGLPGIATKVVSQREEVVWTNFSFPVIVKPNSGSGSVGVKLCYSVSEAKQHISALLAQRHHLILIQEYVEGDEYSAEIYSDNNKHTLIGVTRKYMTEPPFFIETGHDYPAGLSSEQLRKVQNDLFCLLDAIDYTFGFSHIEFKLVNQQVVVIEVNPRLAGGMIPRLIQLATGFDVLDFLIDAYMGKTPTINLSLQRYASIRHLWSMQRGRIKQLYGLDEALLRKTVFVKQVGDELVQYGDFRDRIAYCIESSDLLYDSQHLANKAIKQIKIDIENIND